MGTMIRALWRRLGGLLRSARTVVSLDDYCGPDCDEHAYCMGLQAVLAGRVATLVTAVDSEDAPAVYVFEAAPDREALKLARHPSELVRASFAYARVAGARTGLLNVGEIKP